MYWLDCRHGDPDGLLWSKIRLGSVDQVKSGLLDENESLFVNEELHYQCILQTLENNLDKLRFSKLRSQTTTLFRHPNTSIIRY